MKIDTSEHVRTILGVEGRAFARRVWPNDPKVPERARGLWSTQTWGASRSFEERGKTHTISVALRFDDNCRNGRHSFAITGEVWGGPRMRDERNLVTAGCIHDDIANRFPELAPLIKWHLFDQTGPMHYVANTLYLAGNRDHWRRAPGEPSAWETFVYFGDSPVGHKVNNFLGDWIRERMTPGIGTDVYVATHEFEVRAHDHPRDVKTYGTRYTLALAGSAGEYAKGREDAGWHTCPFQTELEAQQFALALNTCRVRIAKTPTEFSTGKPRELDKARAVAVWPDATDEELSQDPETLKAVLLARLPGLVAEFRRAMVEVCGFAWEAPQS